MNKTIWAVGAFFGLTAVALGALGSHVLRESLTEAALGSFQTGVQYQMYHALFLLVLGSQKWLTGRHRKLVFGLVTAGVVCFSFSIYALSTQALTGLDFGSIALVTPLGGGLLLVGWGWVLYRALVAIRR